MRRGAALLCLLLASVHLVYLPHAEFLLDDWGVLARYEKAGQEGPAAQAQVAVDLLRNRFHGQFRFQWISFQLGYLLYLLFGWAPAPIFAASVLVHAACALALARAVRKLGIGEAPALLSGTLFVLLPTTHGPLLWSHNCGFFLWSTLWFLLYLGSLAASLREGRLDGRAALRQAALLLAALFSGDPVFVLLLAAAPAVGLYLRSKLAWRATLLAWGTVAAAAAFYALVINQTPLLRAGVGLRYDFDWENLRGNLLFILATYRRLSGLGREAFFELRLTPAAAAAGLAALGVALAACRRPEAAGRRREVGRPMGVPWRPMSLAAALWTAAYGPIWFIRGHEYRYDYVPSPYLALGLSLAVLALPAGRLLGPALAAWMAVATVANIQQGWIPQSRNLRAVGAALRGLGSLEPGDLIIVSGTRLWIGAAPHFAFLAGWASSAFAQRATGVPGLEAAREIASEAGRLRIYHRNYMRDLNPGETSRTRVLVAGRGDRIRERRLLAQQVAPGAFRVYPLKGYSGPPPSTETYTREQLGLMRGTIYFAPQAEDHRALDW